jgi:LmbE family N-acetylglucosaminyl deacetylase
LDKFHNRMNKLIRILLRSSNATIFLLVVLILFTFGLQTLPTLSTHAQEQATPTAPVATEIDRVTLHQALLDISNPWTVMCIAAHPDDEDGTTLTVLRHKHGVHTVSVFSTYGEGGQNIVGPELYEELGVIRARETMAAAEIQGSEPYFLGLKDFGFSKSADEAFRVWGHDEALRRLVLKIRELRPDVIITNHDTTSGHGHHQATGRLLLEAFDAAADPRRFPEQIKDSVQVWQVKRVFVRARSSNRSNPQAPDTNENLVTIDPNEQDPVRGTRYAEQALQALQKHETQGPWPRTVAQMASRFRLSNDGKLPLIRYRLVREAPSVAALSKGAGTFLDDLKLPDNVTTKLAVLKIEDRSLFDFESQPDVLLQFLVAARKAGMFQGEVPGEGARLRVLRERLDRAFALLSHTTLTLTASNSVLVAGASTNFSVNLSNAGNRELAIGDLRLIGMSSKPIDAPEVLPAGTDSTKTIRIQTPRDTAVSVPSARHLYDGLLFGRPLVADATVALDGALFHVRATNKLEVTPKVEIGTISPSPYVWSPATSSQPLTLKVRVTNHLDQPFNGTLSLSGAQNRFIETGKKISLAPQETREILLEASGQPSDVLRAPGTRKPSAVKKGSIAVTVRDAGNQEVTGDSVQLVYTDAGAAPGIHVGFIPSFDRTIEASLKSLGVKADQLSVADIQSGNLSGYDTVIIDNRGYEAHPELIAANDHLLSFVREGGTLVVFYHKDNEWNPDAAKNRPQLAPYPIILDDIRVTDENAVVTFLERKHSLLNFPNEIGPAHFENWIQERGLYYPKEWDEHYTALLSMHDPGEPPLRGGLLVAAYGRGQYIYTSLVWYRQLRAGIPGAYRMFGNMISYGHR